MRQNSEVCSSIISDGLFSFLYYKITPCIIFRITILKDKETRESKGVAFILFLAESDAHNCVTSFDGKQVRCNRLCVSSNAQCFIKSSLLQIGNRTIRVKIATDNGRSREFIRKRVYTDKSKCYECGESGHLSYECPKNTLGYRKPPPKKKKKKQAGGNKVGRFLYS